MPSASTSRSGHAGADAHLGQASRGPAAASKAAVRDRRGWRRPPSRCAACKETAARRPAARPGSSVQRRQAKALARAFCAGDALGFPGAASGARTSALSHARAARAGFQYHGARLRRARRGKTTAPLRQRALEQPLEPQPLNPQANHGQAPRRPARRRRSARPRAPRAAKGRAPAGRPRRRGSAGAPASGPYASTPRWFSTSARRSPTVVTRTARPGFGAQVKLLRAVFCVFMANTSPEAIRKEPDGAQRLAPRAAAGDVSRGETQNLPPCFAVKAISAFADFSARRTTAGRASVGTFAPPRRHILRRGPASTAMRGAAGLWPSQRT